MAAHKEMTALCERLRGVLIYVLRAAPRNARPRIHVQMIFPSPEPHFTRADPVDEPRLVSGPSSRYHSSTRLRSQFSVAVDGGHLVPNSSGLISVYIMDTLIS